MDSTRRGRFAPTPSGDMHLGNAKIALLSWLQIRAANGVFLLRIEDIDLQRSRPEKSVQIMDDLRWLGLDWDEGPGALEPHSPYFQSQRLELYADALNRLEGEGLLYPCYCSRAELHGIAGAPHGLASEGAPYSGACRRLTKTDRAERARRKTPSLRFALPEVPQDQLLCFQDGIAGAQQFPPGCGGDFVVRRADGMYSYQLAVTVDDALMEITDVLRGDDLLDSTPRQIQLYRALGWGEQIPSFAHAPLLLGADGTRLAKRHGDLSIACLRSDGVLPTTLIGWLAYVSGLIDRFEPLTASDLIAEFTLEKLHQEPFVVTGQALSLLYGN